MRESLLFELHVSMQVDLRGLRRLVTKPEGDYAQINTAPQKIHGRRVAERVGRHGLSAE